MNPETGTEAFPLCHLQAPNSWPPLAHPCAWRPPMSASRVCELSALGTASPRWLLHRDGGGHGPMELPSRDTQGSLRREQNGRQSGRKPQGSLMYVGQSPCSDLGASTLRTMAHRLPDCSDPAILSVCSVRWGKTLLSASMQCSSPKSRQED